MTGCTRIETVYFYDVDPQSTYGTANNRLMQSQTTQTCRIFEDNGNCATEPDTLLEESWYYYRDEDDEDHANVTRVLTKKEGESFYLATRLIYGKNSRVVAYVAGETWDYPGGDSLLNPTNYAVTYARGFLYDGARQRYLNETYDAALVMAGTFTPTAKSLSDYDGNQIYLDRDSLTGQNTRSYEPGTGTFSWSAGVPDTNSDQYYHTNMIGTTRFMTDTGGSGVEPATYTAFGEQRRRLPPSLRLRGCVRLPDRWHR